MLGGTEPPPRLNPHKRGHLGPEIGKRHETLFKMHQYLSKQYTDGGAHWKSKFIYCDV